MMIYPVILRLALAVLFSTTFTLGALSPVVFLRRVDGSQDFYLPWENYTSGFGDAQAQNGEFWLGLETLHSLTTPGGQYGLEVTLGSWSGETLQARYSYISVGGASEEYKLSLAGYDPQSTAGSADSLSHSRQMAFSTYDRDNDARCAQNCAENRKGGWWYRACAFANPTGQYLPARTVAMYGITWYHAYRDWTSFRNITMTLIPN